MADPLISAIKRSDAIALRRTILSCTNLNCVDSQGWTPLFHAAAHGNSEAVRLLIQAGADVNHGMQTGFTALFSAVMGGRVDIVRILLEAGAKIVPVGGTNLRGFALMSHEKNRDELVAILDLASSAAADA